MSVEGSPPSGVVAFVFTDVEGSTRLWAADAVAMSASLQVHDRIVREAVESRGGFVFTTAGDSFAVAFPQASAAVDAAVAIQADLAEVAWPGPELRVRIGAHLGETEERGGDYFGPVVNATARVEAAGHGGQVIVTEAVQAVVGRRDLVDLGVHQLRDLPEPLRLFQVGAGEFPRLRGVGGAADNLPQLRSRLVGRDREVGELANLVVSDRLVTVVGPGGIGKTTVAIETAGKVSGEFSGGAHFVDLAAVVDDDGIVGAICRGVRLVTTTAPYERLVEFLSTCETLLVVDNCEHVIDAAADVIDRLIADVDRVAILATSREHLDLDGERVVRIDPLGADVGEAGVRLFVERFAWVQPAFDPTAADLDGVSRICRRLDGMPLAIELAAARGATMTLAEIESRLDDRFALLASGRRGRLRRQQTLRATLDWSIGLLADDEVEALARLSVFVSGFDLDGAAAVSGLSAGRAADVVASLHAKSLIQRVADARGRARYRLLETVREWGLEELDRRGLIDAVQDLHAKRFVDLFARADPLDWLRFGFDWFDDAPDIALAITRIEPTEPVDAALVAAANCYSLIEAGFGTLAAQVAMFDFETVPAEARPRAWVARRIVLAWMLLRDKFMDPPPDDGSRDWALLVGGVSTGHNGIEGFYLNYLEPTTVLRSAPIPGRAGSGRDELAIRMGHLENACIAACHLAHFDDAVRFGRESLELAERADLGWTSASTGMFSLAVAAVEMGIDLRGSSVGRYTHHVRHTAMARQVLAIADHGPEEWRTSLARLALDYPGGRLPGEEGLILALFAFFAIQDGDLDRARRLNQLVSLRTPACLSLKRHNQIRIEQLPIELLHDEDHHRHTAAQVRADLTPKPGTRQAMLDEAERLLS